MNRLMHLAKNILIANLGGPRYPYRLTFILTHKCRFKCSMCNIWKKSAENELSLEKIERFFEKSNRFSWINLSGGEIFLREDLSEILYIIFKHCENLYLLDFPTNGFETEQIACLVKKTLGLHKRVKLLVTVSLDGPRDTHDRIRGIPGSWDKALETFARLRALRNNRFGVFLGMTLQNANIAEFRQTFESVNKRLGGIGYKDFHVNLIQYSKHYYNNIENSGSEDRQILREQLRLITKTRPAYPVNPAGFLEKRYLRLADKYLRENRSPVPCQALSSSFFMDPSGNIYPCATYDKIIGNIEDYDYNIYKLWDNASRNKIRKDIIKGGCPHCWTPCEAYQSILADMSPKFRKDKLDQKNLFGFHKR
jgi:Fe-coproporphyrin III synthase